MVLDQFALELKEIARLKLDTQIITHEDSFLSL